MRKLEYSINISAPKKKVWEIMLGSETYKQWTDVSWPGSYFEGTWKGGETLKFVSSKQQGGTAAVLTEFQQYDHLLAKHVALISADGALDTTSETAQGWIGSTERYTFIENNGATQLAVEINTKPEWESMFNEGWPKALKKLKELCEQ